MALSNPVRDLKRPDISKGTWRGYVIDNKDPQKRQRVKIRIPQLHRGIPDEDLPWAMISNVGQAHSGSGVGSVDVPPEGALVETWFEEDDPHNPRYGGSPPLDSVAQDNELLNEDYPSTVGHIDDAGNKWSVNKQRNEVTFQHKSGTTIFIDGSGNMAFSAAGSISIASGSSITMAAPGGIKIDAGGALDLKGSPINLNGSSAGASANIPSARSTPNIPSRKGQTSL